MVLRSATHAGSWYSDSHAELSSQLEAWLEQVPSSVDHAGAIPQKGARAIIAPHAGYAYSGPPAAWAYKSLDLSMVKRVFLLGPSHHYYLTGCALSPCTEYETPLGILKLDRTTIAELDKTGRFSRMTKRQDEEEHSLEMHLPYIYKVLSTNFDSDAEFPALIPILVGNTSPETETQFGKLLAPFLEDETSLFVVSSDFCHWGTRFSYTYYLPPSEDVSEGISLRSRDKAPSPPIYDSIGRVDRMCMDAITTGRHDDFLEILRSTGNTVCGRHPIGIIMAAIEHLKEMGKITADKGLFQFVKYARSSDCIAISDSSVSYASAFAVI